MNVRGDKVTGTVGAPSTGLSYRQMLVDGSPPGSSEPDDVVARLIAEELLKTLKQAVLPMAACLFENWKSSSVEDH